MVAVVSAVLELYLPLRIYFKPQLDHLLSSTVFSFVHQCQSSIPEARVLSLTPHLPPHKLVCAHTLEGSPPSLTDQWNGISLLSFFFPGSLSEKLTKLMDWPPSALSWSGLISLQILMKFSCFRFINLFWCLINSFLSHRIKFTFLVICIILSLMPDSSFDTEGKFSLCKTKESSPF